MSATSHAIGVLIADSNRMQSQLLATALRRHPEFSITTCTLDPDSIGRCVNSELPRIASCVSIRTPASPTRW